MGVMELWVPILVSSVVIFIVSALFWMVLPHHKADIKVLPDEKKFLDVLGGFNIEPGVYMWPGCADGNMSAPEYKERYAAGPWGNINIQPAQPNFGMNLLKVFILYVVMGIFVAYLTGEARAAGAEFMPVFQIAGAVAVMGYCLGQIPGAIFMGKPTRFIMTDLFDGAVYGIITGIIFAALWPDAPGVGDVIESVTNG